jgi:hypothetical protein
MDTPLLIRPHLTKHFQRRIFFNWPIRYKLAFGGHVNGSGRNSQFSEMLPTSISSFGQAVSVKIQMRKVIYLEVTWYKLFEYAMHVVVIHINKVKLKRWICNFCQYYHLLKNKESLHSFVLACSLLPYIENKTS